MTYELALKLKEAGFPQHIDKYEDCGYLCIHNNPFAGEVRESACNPTLSELIEACGKVTEDSDGDKLNFVLWFDGSQWKSGYNCHFLQGDDYLEGIEYKRIGIGKTPEEAVANLYLALNKK